MKEKIQKVQIVYPKDKTASPVNPRPYKSPSFLSLDSEDLPAIKNFSVGKIYTLMVEVEQTSMSKGDGDGYYGSCYDNDSKKNCPMRARFKILNVKVPGSSDEKPVPRSKKLESLKKNASTA